MPTVFWALLWVLEIYTRLQNQIPALVMLTSSWEVIRGTEKSELAYGAERTWAYLRQGHPARPISKVIFEQRPEGRYRERAGKRKM